MGKVGASRVEAATYVAAYAGMERREDGGKIQFRKRVEEYKEDDGSTRSETVTRVNMFFKIVRGELQGLAVPWSVKVVVDGQPKGFRVLKQASGQAITFDAPSQWSPWLIRVMAACGVDFEGGDLQRPLFETPLTLSSVMEGINTLMLEKAKEGVFVNIETREGHGGLRVATLPKAVPKDMQELIHEKLEQEGQEGTVDAQASIDNGLDEGVPLAGDEDEQEPSKAVERKKYFLKVAKLATSAMSDEDAGKFRGLLEDQASELGINQAKYWEYMNVEQLDTMIDVVVTQLMLEEVEVPRPPWTERPAEDDIEELFGEDVPF